MDKAKLDIDKVAAGMQLAEPVTNAQGVTLMPAGIRLTPMFILRLKKWNITELEVLTDGKNAAHAAAGSRTTARTGRNTGTLSAAQQALAQTIAAEVSGWFVNVRENALMMDLRAVVINRLVAQGGTGLLARLRTANLAERKSGDGAAGPAENKE